MVCKKNLCPQYLVTLLDLYSLYKRMLLCPQYYHNDFTIDLRWQILTDSNLAH